MKVQRSEGRNAPGYPSKKQLLKHGALLGAAAIGLAGGCNKVSEPVLGEMPVEPHVAVKTNHVQQPVPLLGIPPMEPPPKPHTP